MAKQMVAVFLMCIVVFAAVHVSQAEATDGAFKECFETCQKECQSNASGYTFCEMKCDTDCGAKEIKAKLDSLNKS